MRFLTALFIVLVTAFPGRAELVDLELVLAVDISGSVDDDEALLQRNGYIQALTDPRVINTITSGRHKKIAVSYLEWAGADIQRTIVDWQIIDGPASAAAFARQIAAAPLETAFWTSISGIMEYASRRLASSPHHGRRRVIDISGDGANNSGEFVTHARDRTVARGIGINGLVIINGRPSRYGMPPIHNLDLYFEDCVIGGPGAFLIVANGFADFARAIRRKLILEIAGLSPARQLLQLAAARKRPGCDAGEKRLQDHIEDF